jgi:O-antigen/teichoic acid export membrane protein
MTIRRKSIKAVSWQFAARASDRLLRFVSSLILARLLAPEAFGLLAATLSVIGFLETAAFVGTDHAIIQSKRFEDPRFLGSAFRVLLVRGVLLTAVLFAAAPAVAWYFEDPDITPMVRIVAFASLVRGLANPWVAAERRNLHFKAFSLGMVLGGVTQVAVAVAGAWLGFGPESLAAGFVAAAAATSLSGWLLVPRRIDLRRDPEALAEIRTFARRAAGVPFLMMLSAQSPSILLGRFAGLDLLGVYTLQYRLSTLPTEIALPILGNVLSPTYAQLRDDQDRLRAAWLRTMRVLAILVIPITVAVLVLDERIPLVVYGERYATIEWLMTMLGLSIFFQSITGGCGPLFWGLGRPEIDRNAVLIRLGIVYTAGLLMAIGANAVAFAAVTAGSMLVGLGYCLPKACALTGASWREVWHAMRPGMLLGLACFAASSLAELALVRMGAPPLAQVLAITVLCAAPTLAVLWRMRRTLGA